MTTTKNKSTEPPADRALILTRVFNAPRHLVFEARTQKEHLDQWMAPRGFTIASSGGDFCEGGPWHCRMISPTGEPFPVSGVYQKIVPGELTS
jgi:uncharacterized protein YndB with AHSA1/START domain